MSTIEHTPGPWQQNWKFIVAPDPNSIHADIYLAEIAEEDSEGRIASPDQQKANGRLIVAAPALLAACRMVIDRWERGDLAEAARACQAVVEQATAEELPELPGSIHHQGGMPAITTSDDLNSPWSLRFERDGTEDVAVISDANDEELLRSRDFWLPGGNDPDPPTLAAMQVIVAAPATLTALQCVIDYARNEACSLENLKDSPEAETEAERAWKAITTAEAVLETFSTGVVQPPSVPADLPIVTVTVQSGLIDDVDATIPVHVVVEDWDVPDWDTGKKPTRSIYTLKGELSGRREEKLRRLIAEE